MAGPMILNESDSLTLDASGNGTLKMRPAGSHEHWMPTLASVKCSSNTNEASCKIYVGQSANDNNFVDGTINGSSGDSTDRVSGYDISRTTNAYVIAVWAGGDAGATGTMVISGTKEIR